jgi:hypothetical protein
MVWIWGDLDWQPAGRPARGQHAAASSHLDARRQHGDRIEDGEARK